MSDQPTSQNSGAVAATVVPKKRGFSLIWLIPVVAALIGGWLTYTSYSRTGLTITITFESASGLEPGKTKIKYRDVPLGVVSDVELSDDLSHVVVTAAMERSATKQLRKDTVFWVENARVTASGVSGLGTLVSGAFIGVKPGSGDPATTFKGSEEPPVQQITVPGTRYILHSEHRGSISANSPVFYRGIQVGEVLGSTLDREADDVVIHAFVRAPYDELVRTETHFWDASGIDMTVSTEGLKVRTESVVSLLVGGISFDSPSLSTDSSPCPGGTEFRLHSSYDSIREAGYTEKVSYLLYFQGSVSGLKPGAPVTFFGIQIGSVESVQLEVDSTDYSVRVPVVIRIQPQRARVIGQNTPEASLARMKNFVKQGLRAQLRSGSIITGSLVVALDFFPEEDAAEVVLKDGQHIIPTVRSTIEQLTHKATVFLDKLADAPVADLVNEMRETVQTLDRLLASPALRKGLEGLQGTGPLLESIKETSDAARQTLSAATEAMNAATGVVGDDSALRHDLARMLTELTDMAQSVTALTDYLERDPNALIFGKSKSEGE